MTRVSLLLPNRDNERVLDLVLERLAVNTTYGDVELVAVDDGSVDGSRAILRRWQASGRFPRFELIEGGGNGVPAALNMALAAATGELCVQLDADASLETPGWLERMLELMRRDARVGAITGKVVFDDGLLHACGVDVIDPDGLRDRPGRVLEPTGRRRWHYRIERVPDGEHPDADARPAEVDAGIGCCLMFRRQEVIDLGGFDPGYAPVWMDDIDVCLGLRARGLKVFCLPEVKVLHHVSLRDPPLPMTARRAARAVGRRAGRRLPERLRSRLEDRLDADFSGSISRAQRERLRGHYAHWRRKWGWDPLNPDLAAIREHWGDTEICWRDDPERRRAGEAILGAR